MEGMSIHRLRSEMLWSSDLRTGVRLPSGPPSLHDTLESMWRLESPRFLGGFLLSMHQLRFCNPFDTSLIPLILVYNHLTNSSKTGAVIKLKDGRTVSGTVNHNRVKWEDFLWFFVIESAEKKPSPCSGTIITRETMMDIWLGMYYFVLLNVILSPFMNSYSRV